MKARGIFIFAVRILAFVSAAFFAYKAHELYMGFNKKVNFGKAAPTEYSESLEAVKPPTYACGRIKPCSEGHFAFKLTSGAASAVGPRICLEDTILVSDEKRNTGRGINIALVEGHSGILTGSGVFDMFSGDVSDLIAFLKTITNGTIVMMASFNDPASNLSEEARKMIGELGSTNINTIEFRDSWVFVGRKGIGSKSPFEQIKKRSKDGDIYNGWPELVEMDGCIPHLQ
ncbi:protein FAM3C-like [Arapaima gigas]